MNNTKWSRGSKRKVGYYGKYGLAPGYATPTEIKYFDFTTKMAFTADAPTGVQQMTYGVTAGTQPAIFVNNATDEQSLNLIETGAGQSQRIGNKVKCVALKMFLQADFPAIALQAVDASQTGSVPEFNQNLHVCIILDHQANGAAPLWNEVFQEPVASKGTSGGLGRAQDPSMWFKRMDRLSRYTILHRKNYNYKRPESTFIPQDVAADEGFSMFGQTDFKPIEVNIPLRTVIEFQDSVGGTVPLSKICCNNLLCFVFCDNNASYTSAGGPNQQGPNALTCNINGRLCYVG